MAFSTVATVNLILFIYFVIKAWKKNWCTQCVHIHCPSVILSPCPTIIMCTSPDMSDNVLERLFCTIGVSSDFYLCFGVPLAQKNWEPLISWVMYLSLPTFRSTRRMVWWKHHGSWTCTSSSSCTVISPVRQLRCCLQKVPLRAHLPSSHPQTPARPACGWAGQFLWHEPYKSISPSRVSIQCFPPKTLGSFWS